MVFVFTMIALLTFCSCGVKKTTVVNNDESHIEQSERDVDLEYEKFKKTLDAMMSLLDIPEIYLPSTFPYYEYQLENIKGDIENIKAVNYNLNAEGNKYIEDTLELIVYSFDTIHHNDIVVTEQRHNFLNEYYHDLLKLAYSEYYNEERINGKSKVVSRYDENGKLKERKGYNHLEDLVSVTDNVFLCGSSVLETLTLDRCFETLYTAEYTTDKNDVKISDIKYDNESRVIYSYDDNGVCVEEHKYVFRNDIYFGTAYVKSIIDDMKGDYYTTIDYNDEERYLSSETVKTYTYNADGRCEKELVVEYYVNYEDCGRHVIDQIETIYKYDDKGNVIEKNNYKNNELYQRLLLDYDNKNNVIEAKTYIYEKGIEKLVEMIKYNISYIV